MVMRSLGILDRMMEAGWLLAVIVAPLYFNVYSNRVFEPDKIIIVRSIAVLMALAWLVKLLDTRVLAPQSKQPSSQGVSLPLLQRTNQQNILAIPALLLVTAYIISSVGSVAPMITLWGSYQRLQGTFSTFSYIVIFFLAASTIRSRDQLERIITVVILTSIPTAIYGIVEHLKLEFLPWGGDVTLRVTSTMGNPIFIAAYLIMAVPVTLSRLLSRLSELNWAAGDGRGNDGAAAVLLALVEAVAWFLLVYLGLKIYGNGPLGQTTSTLLLVSFLIVLILAVGLPFTVRKAAALYVSASFYGAVLLAQLATIMFSQSRGPQLGLLAGLAVFVFLYAIKKNSRLIWYGGLTLVLLAMAFLVTINIPNSPLAWVRDVPNIGRLATIIEEGGGSTTVRSLIWQGARALIGMHDPLQIPEKGSDALNPIRPLIGYGPDAMYVAYNRFYPPDLAHHEARNASPDRSHNETFDALVMTGILGYMAYWIVFYTVIYMALIYLKVIDERHGRYLYVALLLSGLVALAIIYSSILPIKWTPGPPLLGVAVLGIYLLIAGAATYDWKAKLRSLDVMLIGLVAAVVAHFVEIQFGIAIASTRTHFWLFAAMVVVAGRLNAESAAPGPAQAAPAPALAPAPAPERVLPAAAPRPAEATAAFTRKKPKTVAAGRPRPELRPPAPALRPAQRLPQRPAPRRTEEPGLMSFIRQVTPSVLPLAVVGGVILVIMAYDFMLPPNSTSTPAATTSVQFWLYLTAWLACGLVVAFDGNHDERLDEVNERIAGLVVYTVVSLAMWVLYVTLRSLVLSAGGTQVNPISLVDLFYVVLLCYGLLMAGGLYAQKGAEPGPAWSGAAGGIVYAVAAVLVFFFIVFTNVNNVLSDVYYKTGLAYDNALRYDGSISAYQSSIRLQPSQDFYYLFLGRSFMELARQYPDRKANPVFDVSKESPLQLTRERLATLGRDDLIQSSLNVLLEARYLNPLNTDHYANLARLYNFWGQLGDQSKYAIASQYFAEATSLSPNNAQLWNEWACTYSRVCSDWMNSPALATHLADALEKLQRSLQLDDRYDQTYYYLGNVYMYKGEHTQDTTQKVDQLTRASDAYRSCLDITPTYVECAKARGYIYGKYLGRSQDAIKDFLMVASTLPRPEDLAKITNATQKAQATQEVVNINQNLAITYGQIGQFDVALQYAQMAANLSPQDEALKNLVDSLKGQQKK